MLDLQSLPYHAPQGTRKLLKKDLKLLCDVHEGDIIFILGRLLQPFCSHAVYRVRVTAIQRADHDCLRVFGELIDFHDSPVNSYDLPGRRYFRVERL